MPRFFIAGVNLKEYNTGGDTKFVAIRDWRDEEKPREKLMSKGAESLTDAELLAILLRTGTKGNSALDIARHLLNKYDDLNKLSELRASELSLIKGVGNAKAITIAAAFEIGKRIEGPDIKKLKKVASPGDISKYFIPKLRNKKVECFYAILLNQAGRIIKEVKVSEGILNLSVIHPRELFKIAIGESAASIIVLHNHPSGNTMPSEEDKKVTRQLIEAGKIMQIPVIDHIIIAGDSYLSFMEMGLI
jgi:DNA repair protein RadC